MNLVRLWGDIEGQWTKITKLNLKQKAANLMAIVLVFSFLPSPVITLKKAEPWAANFKIDTTNRLVLKSENKLAVNIQVAESEYGKKIREEAEKKAEQQRIAEEARKAQLIASAKAAERVTKVYYDEPVGDFKSIYQSAGAQYGVPWQILEAVHQVETGKSGSTGINSSAGATGPMQFLPSTWRHYGVDGNGDGARDITDVTDAIYGAANYLAAGGAAEGRVSDALFNYNHSMSYVNKVLGIAREIGF